LQASLKEIIKQAFEITSQDFMALVEKVTQCLSEEKGKVGNLCIRGKLVKVKPFGEALVIGDLHGDLESLIDILQQSNFLQRLDQSSNALMFFLGDYGDRGTYSTEVYYTVLKLKLLHPAQIILMRGNHEGPEDLKPSPHDLPLKLQARFGERGGEVYARLRELFSQLYTVTLVEDSCLMIHGGLPAHAASLEDLACAHATHPETSFLEEMLWSDPNEMAEVCSSPRGAGILFSENITKRMLEMFGVNFLIRGHESCPEGFKFDHGGKVLTLFSRKGPPYFNKRGAYLDLELSERFVNSKQLIKKVHRF